MLGLDIAAFHQPSTGIATDEKRVDRGIQEARHLVDIPHQPCSKMRPTIWPTGATACRWSMLRRGVVEGWDGGRGELLGDEEV